jgi:hypothetical protein
MFEIHIFECTNKKSSMMQSIYFFYYYYSILLSKCPKVECITQFNN